jgi:ribose transport system permease protein
MAPVTPPLLAPTPGAEQPPSRTVPRSVSDWVLQILTGYSSALMLVVLLVVFASMTFSDFATAENFRNIFAQAAPGAMVALAETLTMVVGEFDLSVGYVSSLAGVMFIGFMVNQHMGFLEALLLTLVVAAGFGLLNGVIVVKLGVNAFIGTLGVGIAAVGVNYLYGGGATMAGTLPNVVTQLGIGSAGLSYVAWVWLGVAVALWLYSEQTRPGIHSRAIGGNQNASRLAGLRVSRLKLAAFIMAAVLAASGGILLATQLGSGEPTAGDGYLLDAFAAAFLGTGFYRAGEFSVPGTVLGALVLEVGFNGLAILGYPTAARYLFEGGILVLALGIGAVARRWRMGRSS